MSVATNLPQARSAIAWRRWAVSLLLLLMAGAAAAHGVADKFDYRDRNGGQYVLTYENAAIKQAAKRKLLVVMTTDGKFVSAGQKVSQPGLATDAGQHRL